MRCKLLQLPIPGTQSVLRHNEGGKAVWTGRWIGFGSQRFTPLCSLSFTNEFGPDGE
jgi:hypothetical protein